MFKGFEQFIVETFDMANLEKIRHFLEVEILQDNDGVFMFH